MLHSQHGGFCINAASFAQINNTISLWLTGLSGKRAFICAIDSRPRYLLLKGGQARGIPPARFSLAQRLGHRCFIAAMKAWSTRSLHAIGIHPLGNLLPQPLHTLHPPTTDDVEMITDVL